MCVVAEHLIQPQVRRVERLSVGTDDGGMDMGAFLAALAVKAHTVMLLQLAQGVHIALRRQRAGHQTAAGVVGRRKVPPVGPRRQVAHRRPRRFNPVAEGQSAALGIPPEGGNIAVVHPFADSVNMLPAHHQKGRIVAFRRVGFQPGQRPGLSIETEMGNAVAARFALIRANVNIVIQSFSLLSAIAKRPYLHI